MDRPATAWARLLLRLALVLLAIGLLPVLALQFVFPTADPLIPVLLMLGVAPLGLLALAAAAILFLAALLRR